MTNGSPIPLEPDKAWPFRPEDAIATGTIPLRLGAEGRLLPVLSIRANREWKEKLAATLASTLSGLDGIKTWDEAVGLLSGSTNLMLDLLVAYDQTNVLGGRDWLEDKATDQQVYAAFKEVALAAYPFGRDAAKFPTLLQALMEQVATISQVSSSSTSGPQPTTVGSRRKSKTA